MSTCLVQALIDELPNIDQRSQDTVNGYVRHIEQQFEIIPSIIFHIILAFFWNDEYFAKAGKNVTLLNNNKTVEKGDGGWNNTTYGNHWIDSMQNVIVKWEFRIDYNDLLSTGLSFVIVSNDNRPDHSNIEP